MPDHYRASYYWPQMLKDNPGLGVSLAYAALTVFGAAYAAWFYFILNVRFLELTDVSDFLVMVFREPAVALFLLLPIPFFSVYMALSYRLIWWVRWRWPKWFAKVPDPSRPPKHGPALQRTMGYAFFVVYALAFTQFYGLWSALRVRDGKGSHITLEMRPIMWPADTALRRDVMLLGTTSRFTIVYDPEEERAWSVPHDSIARILHPERPSRVRAREEAEAKAKAAEEAKTSPEMLDNDSVRGTEAEDAAAKPPNIPHPPG